MDSRGVEFHFFFDRFLGRLCFGENQTEENAAYLKKGSRIQHELFQLMKALCEGKAEYSEIAESLERAARWV